MLPKGEYRVRITVERFVDDCPDFREDIDDLCVLVSEIDSFIDVEDFLDVHHRGLLGQAIDDLRDELIRNVFKADHERTF